MFFSVRRSMLCSENNTICSQTRIANTLPTVVLHLAVLEYDQPYRPSPITPLECCTVSRGTTIPFPSVSAHKLSAVLTGDVCGPVLASTRCGCCESYCCCICEHTPSMVLAYLNLSYGRGEPVAGSWLLSSVCLPHRFPVQKRDCVLTNWYVDRSPQRYAMLIINTIIITDYQYYYNNTFTSCRFAIEMAFATGGSGRNMWSSLAFRRKAPCCRSRRWRKR